MPSLDRMVHDARRGVGERRDRTPLAELQRIAADLDPIRPFTESVVGEEIAIVPHLRAADARLLAALEAAEVEGVAVTTASGDDDGSAEALARIAAQTSLPILQHDVIVDPYQLYEGRVAGAHGAVLIAAAFRDEHEALTELFTIGYDLGLDVVVEVREEEEVDEVLDLLDPDSFLLRNDGRRGDDLERAFTLLEEVPAGKVVLADGGIRTRDAVLELERAGVDAVLVGADVLGADPAAAIQDLRGNGR
jgi:indole-3-glycerol phosphate synthase